MKIWTTIIMGVAIILVFNPGLWAQYGPGEGTADNPYEIHDPNHMQAIGVHPEHWGCHFKLMADIELSQFTGTQFNIIGTYIGYNDPGNQPFIGVFDGNGYKIQNYTYSTTSVKNGLGLFGYLGSPVQIKDLRLEDVYVETSGYWVGSLVGYNYGTISNCNMTGSVTGNNDIASVGRTKSRAGRARHLGLISL